ncbi:MAG: hypothetical protein IKL87_07240 [Oscillospiraceae bacterium]|nr:hypothetical protein [Oscillospiraceae bacterium]
MKHAFLRFLSGITSVSLMLGYVSPGLAYAADTETPTFDADINQDGKVDGKDSNAILQLIGTTIETLSAAEGYEAYDANQNGIIDPADALAVLQFANGDRKSLPAPTGSYLDESLTLSCNDAVSFVNEDTTVDFNIVDWTKDIAAYDFIFHTGAGLNGVSVECTGSGQSIIDGNTIRIFGLASDLELNRGHIASIHLSAEAVGEFPLSLDVSNIYTSNLDYYRSEDPTATITSYDLFAPVALTGEGVSSNSVKLSWQMPYSEQPISGFGIFRDGEQVGDTVETSFLDTGLKIDTEYTYTVCAFNTKGEPTEHTYALKVKTGYPIMKSAGFPSATISYTNSNLAVQFNQKTLLSSLSVQFGENGEALTKEFTYEQETFESLKEYIDVSGLTSGEYPVNVIATDIDGQVANYKFTVKVLNEKPAPLVVEGYAGSESVTLTWDIAPEPDVTQYYVYRQTEEDKEPVRIHVVDSRSKLDFTDTMLDAAKEYTYGVTAVTSFGLEGEMSNLVTVQPDDDTTAPQITLFTPKSGKRLARECIISITATDNSRMDHVECLISSDSGETWETLFSAEGASANFTLNTADYPDGVYHLKAMAYDAAGNASLDTYVNIYDFDNTAPAPVQGINLKEIYPTTATLAWEDVPEQDFSAFLVTISGDAYLKNYTVTNKLGVSLSGLTPGKTYLATIAVVDQTGNVGEASEPFTFTTPDDVTAPVVTYLAVPSTIRNGERYEATLTVSDESPISTYYFQYSQDKVNWKTSSSSTRYVSFYVTGLEDGVAYVRAYAVDRYHNSGKPENAIIHEIQVDNTPPSSIPTLAAEQVGNTVKLSWNKIDGESKQFFVLERSLTGETNSYTEIVTNTYATSYTDRNVVPDTTYYYRIAIVDAIGNRSAFSEPIEIHTETDSVPPTIAHAYLSAAGIICEVTRIFQVIAKDDVCLKEVSLSYAVDDSEEFTELTGETETNSDSTSIRVMATLPEKVLNVQKVTIRVIATDIAGNSTEPTDYSFPVDNSKAQLENVKAEPGDAKVDISWECPDLTDVKCFDLYRTVNDGITYTLASNIRPVADKTTYSYTDTRLNESGSYVYMLVAHKKSGNITTVTTEPLDIIGIPVPKLIVETTQKLGAAYYFDATESTVEKEITSVVIDYGDGTSDETSKVSSAKFQHTYEAAGEYTVTLTCTNSAGVSKSCTTVVNVEDVSQLANVNVQVKTTTGEPASYISVYMDVGTDQQASYETDANGFVNFLAPAGEHEIGVFGNNYLPVTQTVKLIPGADNQVDFSVVCNQLVDASFEITRMTLSEIKAAGINVADPNNMNIVRIDVQLFYASEDIAKTKDDLKIFYDFKEERFYLPEEMQEKGYEVRSIKLNNKKDEIDAIVLMQVPTEVYSLKEFFNIKMVVINNADEPFTLEDCSATLNVPDGLTIMEENSSPRTAKMPDIKGKGTGEVNWIVRGDQKGNYKISADFNATLAKFNEPVSYNFVSDQKIYVLGSSALDIELNLNPSISNNKLRVEVKIHNKSGINVNMVGAKIKDQVYTINHTEQSEVTAKLIQSRFTGTDGVRKVLDNMPETLDTLQPGETFSLLYEMVGLSGEYNFKTLKAIGETLKTNFQGDAKVTVNIKPVGKVDVNSLFYGIKFDREKDFLIAVRNKARQELQDAAVTIYHYESGKKIVHAQGVTDERGRLIVPRDPDDTNGYIISVTKNGYDDHLECAFHFTSNSTSKIIVMQGEYDEKDYKLTSAEIIDDTRRYYNVLTAGYTITQGITSNFQLTVKGSTDITKYAIVQDGYTIKNCTPDEEGKGIFQELRPSQFDPGETVVIRSYLETGDYIETKLKITVAENPERYEANIAETIESQILDNKSVGMKVPDSIPFISGLEINLALPELKGLVDIETSFKMNDKDTLKVEFEVSVNGCKPEGKASSPTYSNADTAIQNISQLANKVLDTPTISEPKELFKLKLGKAEGYFSIGLCASGTWDLDTSDFEMKAQIYLIMGLGGEILYHPFIIPTPILGIPAFFTLEGDLSLKAGAQLKIQKGKKPDFKFLLNPSLTLEAQLCLGGKFDDFEIAVGFAGDIGANVEFVFPPAELQLFEISGNVYFHVGVGFYEHDFLLIGGKYEFYPGGSGEVTSPFFNHKLSRNELLALGVTEEQIEEMQEQMQAPAPKKPAAIWNGALSEDGSLSVLEANAASSSAPQLVACGDTAMLIWTSQDAARGTYNAQHLVYSIYDQKSRTWSNPQQVDDNLKPEHMPSVISTENGIYLVYQEANTSIADGEEIDYVAAMTDISLTIARYDAESGKFTDFTAIPTQKEGNFISTGKFLEGADGKLYMFYPENSVYNRYDADAANTIYCTTLTEDGWSESTAVCKNIPALNGYACMNNADGQPMVAYLSDADSDFTTNDDIQLIVSDLEGTSYVLKQGALSGLTYSSLPQGGKGLMWLENNAFCYSDNLNDAKVLCQPDGYLVSTSYAVHGSQIFFNGSCGDETAFYSTTYNADTASFAPPVMVADMDGTTFAQPQLLTVGNETLYAFGGISYITNEEKPEEITSVGSVLCGTLTETTDVTLDDVTYSMDTVTAGKEFPATLYITNNGSKPIPFVTAALVDAEGRQYEVKEIETNLLPGENGTFEYAPILPADYLNKAYSISITPEHEDCNPDDNALELQFRLTDLSIETFVEYDEDESFVTLIVTNNSQLPTNAAIIAENSQEETLRLISDEIAAGSSVVFTVDAKELLGSAKRDFVSLTVQPDIYDYNTRNNTATVLLAYDGFHDEELGDIDFNGVINSDDSTLILKHYLDTVLEQPSELSAAQVGISDINADDTINADDANYVLLYYVSTMIGTTDQTLSDFIESYLKGGSAE